MEQKYLFAIKYLYCQYSTVYVAFAGHYVYMYMLIFGEYMHVQAGPPIASAEPGQHRPIGVGEGIPCQSFVV